MRHCSFVPRGDNSTVGSYVHKAVVALFSFENSVSLIPTRAYVCQEADFVQVKVSVGNCKI